MSTVCHSRLDHSCSELQLPVRQGSTEIKETDCQALRLNKLIACGRNFAETCRQLNGRYDGVQRAEE